MKISVLLVALCIAFQLNGQCDGNRYLNRIFSDVSITTDVLYGSATASTGGNEQLYMDVYEPTGDDLESRPLIIMCHGGFFISGDKAGPDMVPLCEDFARMGYVVASINYRMGVSFLSDLDDSFSQAVLRAVQDLRGAIRWFRKNVAEDGNTYSIDPEMIFTFGSSAGAFMALHHAFMDQDELPSFMNQQATGLEGGVEGVSGSPGYPSHVRALVSHCGALGDNAWIDEDENVPSCLFHGENDGTVPIDSTMFVFSGFLPVAVTEGSIPISQRMTSIGLEHCFEINDNAGHVAYIANQAVYDTTLAISSNFLAHHVCGFELDCTYREVLTSTEEILAKTSMQLYPNPAQHEVWITGATDNTISTVYTSEGRLAIQQRGARIDVSALTPGIYIVEMNDGGRSLNRQRLSVVH